MYGVPGVHKDADAFNRVQRGHQNGLEYATLVAVTSLTGGIKHPYAAALGTVMNCAGSYFYQLGYADTKLDVKMARYKKGGGARCPICRL